MTDLSRPIRAFTRSARAPWIALSGLILVAMASRASRPTETPARVEPAERPRRTIHYVTPRQVVDSNAMVRTAVPEVSAVDQVGTRRDWSAISGGLPVVLVFAKQGCPCNAEFDPFFRRVERLYQGEVRFALVIDADVDSARVFADELRIAYPVLADPRRELIRRFRAENGGYVALLAQDATIEGLWPGCSADGLRELGRRIARLAGVDERPIETGDMPGALITGCPFES